MKLLRWWGELKDLAENLRARDVGEVLLGAALCDHTTYRVGGPAALLVRPTTIEKAAETIRLLTDARIEWFVLGWGSNLLVSDDGYPGVAIQLAPSFRYVHIPTQTDQDEGQTLVTVGAATTNRHLVSELHGAGYSGAEFLALIPGTFGGAVVMNAGTGLGELSDILDQVTVVTGEGQLQTIDAATLNMAYRHCELPEKAMVTEGVIRVCRGGVEAGRDAIRNERERRERTQPVRQPSAGSVFVNPPGDFAGRLIEAVGLKGRRVGGAVIAEQHANFIVTEKGATASDVFELMALVFSEVKKRFGVSLTTEQRLVGFTGQPSDLMAARSSEKGGHMTDRHEIRVGVLKGGVTREREISLATGSGCAHALREAGFDVVEIDWRPGDQTALIESQIKAAFLALHGGYGEGGSVQGLLNCLAIPYTGAGVLGSAIAMDKVLAKRAFVHAGLSTPDFEVLEEVQLDSGYTPSEDWKANSSVVKPRRSGSSVGITVVEDPHDLAGAIEQARELRSGVFLERYIKGDELSVGIFDDDVLGTVQIAPAEEFYDYHAKYKSNQTQYLIPPPIESEVIKKVEALAYAAYQLLDCRGVARVDIMLDSEKVPWLLEVNTLPGMTETSLIPKLASARGISFSELVSRMVAAARVDEAL